MKDEHERSMHSLIIRYLVAHTQCSGCGRRYAPEDVHLRHRRGDIWLASVVCRHCGLQGLIMAAVSASHADEMEAATDRDAEERTAMREMGPISSDEVLDFHRLLEEFSGDMRKLMRRRRGKAKS
jgi:hypothetical protein